MRISEITWQEYRDAVEETFIILPIGSTEQHAPHLPLGVDSILAEEMAALAAKKTGALVAPVIQYGYKSHAASGGGPLFPGTIDLTGKTFINLIADILEELLADGWKKIFIMNAHFENLAFISEACDMVTRNENGSGAKILISSWWDNISDSVMEEVFDKVEFPGWELEHAAIAETSMMLYFREDLVKVDLIVDEGMEKLLSYQIFPPPRRLVKESGSLHTAVSSSREKGVMLVTDVIDNMVEFIKAEYSID